MAKNRKQDDLLSSMSGRKGKPSAEEIEQVAKEIHSESTPAPAPKSEKLKGLHVLLPQNDYDRLGRVAKATSFPKKIIVLQALRDYFEKHGH